MSLLCLGSRKTVTSILLSRNLLFSLSKLSLGEAWWCVISSFMEMLIGKELMSLANNQWGPTACEQPSDWVWKWISEAKSELNELGSRFSLRRTLTNALTAISWETLSQRHPAKTCPQRAWHNRCVLFSVSKIWDCYMAKQTKTGFTGEFNQLSISIFYLMKLVSKSKKWSCPVLCEASIIISLMQTCTHLKCIIRWVMKNACSCVTNTLIKIKSFCYPRKFPHASSS